MIHILFIIALAIVGTLAFAGISAAPWVPTFKRDIARFKRAANIQPGHVVIDLGCGDGRLLEAAAQEGAHAHGYEIALLPYLIAHIRRLHSPHRKNIHLHYRNMWKANISSADTLYVFLTPKISKRLQTMCEAQLKPGTTVLTYTFPIEGWTPLAIDKPDRSPALYTYRV